MRIALVKKRQAKHGRLNATAYTQTPLQGDHAGSRLLMRSLQAACTPARQHLNGAGGTGHLAQLRVRVVLAHHRQPPRNAELFAGIGKVPAELRPGLVLQVLRLGRPAPASPLTSSRKSRQQHAVHRLCLLLAAARVQHTYQNICGARKGRGVPCVSIESQHVALFVKSAIHHGAHRRPHVCAHCCQLRR